MQTLALAGEVEELHNERNCVLRVGRVGFSNNTIAIDTSGRGNDGTCTGNCVWNNSANAYYVIAATGGPGEGGTLTIADDSSISPGAGDFSVSVWFKTSRDYSTLFTSIICNYGADVKSMYRIDIVSADNKLGFYYRDENGNQLSSTGQGAVINDNKWHHTVSVRKGTVLHTYLDGVEIGSNTNVSIVSINTMGGGLLYIGSYASTPSSLSYFYDGYAANILFYSRALSAAEIHKLYLKGKDKHK